MKQGNRRAAHVLERLFASLRIDARGWAEAPHDVVAADVGDRMYTFAPIWVGEGFPQDVERALRQSVRAGPEVPVFVARKMSKGSVELLESTGLGWADERGHARIVSSPGLFIARNTSKAITPAATGLKWSNSAGAVAEYLLTVLGPNLHTVKSEFGRLVPPQSVVADELAISAAQVSKVLQAFDQEGWTRKFGAERGPGSSRSLDDASGLLSSWAAWQSSRRVPSVKGHATWRDPHSFLVNRLAPALPLDSWCLTGWLAADMRAPFVSTTPSISCYVEPGVFDHNLDLVMDEVGIRPVESGARVTFLRAEPIVMRLASRGSVPVVDDVRLYSDLLAAGSRGAEAADHMREVLLGF